MSNSTTLSFSAQTSKVLQLMIHSLYTNKDIFLRELISNASDALDKLRFASVTEPKLLEGQPEMKISLSSDKKARTLTITDTGIGMNRQELIDNLGTIAKSGTQEFLNQLSGDKNKDITLIGQFGVGFYSSFMVAEKVAVLSRKAGEEKAWRWESEGTGEFTVREEDKPHSRGTSITLHLKEGEDEYLDKFRLKHIATTYSDHIPFPIEFMDEEGKVEKLNTASALWMRPKSEITPEQYKEFYHHVAHSPDEPWMTLHSKAEGTMEYTSLLFIPSIRPFDLFHPDRRARAKLYVKRVFITEDAVNLLPQYMRFLRGVVDSEDLPLNISRETLQKNPLMDKIRDSIVKRVLGELKKKAKKKAEEYAKFWKNFGAVLKEGLCEAIAPKEQILEVCRFYSSESPEKLTSLDEYIGRMKEKQEAIYFLTGDRVETMLKSPQLEGFLNRSVEVLLLTDHVDDFWTQVVHQYKEKPFKSITRANINLSDIPLKEDKKEEKEAPPKEALEPLIKLLKDTFGEEVRDVRLSHKLTESAVCLVVDEGSMDMRLERFLIEQKQLKERLPKVLEVNPSHPIIQRLAEKAKSGALNDEVKDAARLLLDQARITEGEEITDPAAFSRRLTSFLQKGLAA